MFQKICFEGPDEVLKQTVNTQSCLLTVSIAALEALKEASNGSIKADYTLGHSLGEYSALYTAGVMDLDTTFTSRDIINEKLRTILDEATNKWGVKINRVELQDIIPPKEIQNAMENK